MKDTIMSRIHVLPFNVGCLSKSTTRNAKIDEPNNYQVAKRVDLEGEKRSSMVKINKSWHSDVAPSRSYISKAMDTVIRIACKGFTNMFAYKDIEDVKVDKEKEMEIGFPTDVKHVTHVGYDGSTTTNHEKSWDHFQPHETLSFPSVSLKQLELAFAGQGERQDP